MELLRPKMATTPITQIPGTVRMEPDMSEVQSEAMSSATNPEGAPIPKRGIPQVSGPREINEAEKSILQMAGFSWVADVEEISVWKWEDGSAYQKIEVIYRGPYLQAHHKRLEGEPGRARHPRRVYVSNNMTIVRLEVYTRNGIDDVTACDTLDGFYFMAEAETFEPGDPVWVRVRDD